jgi:glycosyltransferase involved in cell wall biosynthesis
MKASNAEVWVVVPAYNEAATIGGVVASLRAHGYSNVCVVNDGSGDESGTLARRAGAYVLDHAVNLGQGASLQTGIRYSLERGAQYICTFDADGQHDAASLADLLGALDCNDADVALGSRFLGETCAVPYPRRALLKLALLFTRMHAHIDVTDTHNGLRAFTRRAAESIEIEQPGMAHASEILQKIGAAKLNLVEVPVAIAYTAYSQKKGQSGFDSVKILLDLLYRSIALRP